MTTRNLSLIPLESAQSQKHITVNEAFARVDAAIQLSVIDRTHTAPPPTPEDGERYLIAAPASGAWLSRDGEIAVWDASALGWQFLTPQAGWRMWVEAESLSLIHDGTVWSATAGVQLGINAGADATNRLAVASDAVLLTHDGAGMRAKMNKASAADTASLLFQDGYTGHAEIGLTGDNNLHIKTSADGSIFAETMVVDAATGSADFPSGASVEGLSLHPSLMANCLPDAGRFGGEAVNADRSVPTFVSPSYLQPYNGATFTGHARFIENSATYGGSQPALDPEVISLLNLIRDPAYKRYGVEWWAMKVNAGSGQLAANTTGGTTRYTAFFGRTTQMPIAYTVGYYVRALTGSAMIDQQLTSRFARWGTDETGNDAAGVITPADGWVFIERQMTVNAYGYNSSAFRLFLESANDEALVALPRIVFGHVALDPYLPAPLANMRFHG